MDKILLPQIDVIACHGAEQWEQSTPQPFRISVELELDLSPAAESDQLADTIHYGELYAAIIQLAESERFALIETLADAVARLCLADGRVEAVRVAVEKTRAKYKGFTFPAIVEIERSRQ